jgi:hypothetical protein
MGIFDQDVDDKVSLAVPQLYMRGIERKEWSQTKFWYVAPPTFTAITAGILTSAGCTWPMDCTSQSSVSSCLTFSILPQTLQTQLAGTSTIVPEWVFSLLRVP